MQIATAATVLVRHPHAVLSHHEAARALGIELVERTWTPRFTVPRNHSHVREPGWEVRRCDVPSRLLVDGLRVTPAARTVLDLATVLPVDQAVAAADSALRKKLLTAAVLTAAVAGMRGRGRPEARSVAQLVDAKAGSVLESLLRVLLLTSGVRAPATQAVITDRRDEVARVDFCWRQERLIVETDGFAFHSDRLAYRRDRERMNVLERLGWRVLRFTWEDVVGRPAHVVELVSACLAPAA